MQISENHMMSPFCACVLQQSAATLAGNRGHCEPASVGSLGVAGLCGWCDGAGLVSDMCAPRRGGFGWGTVGNAMAGGDAGDAYGGVL